MKNIPYIDDVSSRWNEGSVNPRVVLRKYREWGEYLEEGLKDWLREQDMGYLRPDDLHEGNYGFREPSMDSSPVYFDMSFSLQYDSKQNSPYGS